VLTTGYLLPLSERARRRTMDYVTDALDEREEQRRE